jgi:hypothetical protein|tara:strand:- start:414 stop:911 length:498 start_codon:yes stop_codon:yes gene_type:complete
MKKNNLSTIPGFEIGKNFEESVVRLENDLKSMADGDSIIAGTDEDPIVTDSEKVPIRSFFMDGVYVREMTMYQGTAVIGAIHKHLHMCFLLEGHLSVASSSGVRDYVAPCYIIAEPGEKRVLYAHEDSLWYNTHKNPDNIEDVKLLEKDIVATSYEEYEQYIKNK